MQTLSVGRNCTIWFAHGGGAGSSPRSLPWVKAWHWFSVGTCFSWSRRKGKTDRNFFVRERGVLTRYMNRSINPNRTHPNPFAPFQALQTHKGVSPLALTLLAEPEALLAQSFSEEAQGMMWELVLRQQKPPWCVLYSVPVLSPPNQWKKTFSRRHMFAVTLPRAYTESFCWPGM